MRELQKIESKILEIFAQYGPEIEIEYPNKFHFFRSELLNLSNEEYEQKIMECTSFFQNIEFFLEKNEDSFILYFKKLLYNKDGI